MHRMHQMLASNFTLVDIDFDPIFQGGLVMCEAVLRQVVSSGVVSHDDGSDEGVGGDVYRHYGDDASNDANYDEWVDASVLNGPRLNNIEALGILHAVDDIRTIMENICMWGARIHVGCENEHVMSNGVTYKCTSSRPQGDEDKLTQPVLRFDVDVVERPTRRSTCCWGNTMYDMLREDNKTMPALETVWSTKAINTLFSFSFFVKDPTFEQNQDNDLSPDRTVALIEGDVEIWDIRFVPWKFGMVGESVSR